MEATPVATQPASATAGVRRKPFYRTLWGQVLLGVCIAVVVGYVSPPPGEAMGPLGDAFIRLITMVISLVIFCTVAAGIAGMESIKKVGRVGGKALIYFEIATSLALILGLLVDTLDGLTHAVFGVINILMRLAPIGAFGAMAYTVGRYGLSSLGPLAQLIVTLWITSALFVIIVLGGVAAIAGFSIIRY